LNSEEVPIAKETLSVFLIGGTVVPRVETTLGCN
jgi:hypothetical protein